MNRKRAYPAQSSPRHAIILAAGLGTRLRPLTYTLPKPLMPLWGRPMLEHSIRQVARWGVTDILINLHYSAEKIIHDLRRLQIPGVRLNFSFEPEILGTGGALRKAQWFIDGRGPFWLLNSDIAFDLDPLPLRRALAADENNLAALWLEPQRGPRTVQYEKGQVLDFNSNKDTKDRATFTGLHLLRPDILEFLPKNGAASIITAYEKAMRHGRRIAAATIKNSFWADIGNIDDYLDAHARIRKAARTGTPGYNLYNASSDFTKKTFRHSDKGWWAAGGKSAVIKNSRMQNCVFMGDNRVNNCHLKNAVLTQGVNVAHDMEGAIIPLRDYPQERAIAWALRKTGWHPEDVYINPLPGRGSDRAYIRLATADATVILCTYGGQRPENLRIFKHTALLAAHGIRVPRILFREPRLRAYLQEDCGITSLGDCVDSDAQNTEHYYRPVIDILIKLQSIQVRGGTQRFEPAFDAALFRWEHDLFVDMFLNKHTGIRAHNLRSIRRELSMIAECLCELPRVLVHRDMQSTNVLWHQAEPVLIDFQGMRPGPAAYDLASLLCDPYMMLDETVQNRLLDYYNLKAPCPMTAELFWTAAIQRLTQALGAYGRLAALPGTQRFASHIPAAKTMLQRAISESSMQLPALTNLLRHGRNL